MVEDSRSQINGGRFREDCNSNRFRASCCRFLLPLPLSDFAFWQTTTMETRPRIETQHRPSWLIEVDLSKQPSRHVVYINSTEQWDFVSLTATWIVLAKCLQKVYVACGTSKINNVPNIVLFLTQCWAAFNNVWSSFISLSRRVLGSFLKSVTICWSVYGNR